MMKKHASRKTPEKPAEPAGFFALLFISFAPLLSWAFKILTRLPDGKNTFKILSALEYHQAE